MRPSDLAGQRVLLLGVGTDVAAALPAVLGAGPASVQVVDAAPDAVRAALLDAGYADLAATVVEHLHQAGPADVAVRSPGVSVHAADLQERIRSGLVTTTPLSLWLSQRDSRPSVAVTGTKGKSSTTVLAVQALVHLGVPAVALGNIGVPPWTHDPGTHLLPVLEVSSFQAADLAVTSPVAVLTELGEDHVDWHGSTSQYRTDKSRVFRAPTVNGRRWCGVLDDVAVPPEFHGIVFARLASPGPALRARNATLAAAAALAVTGGDPAGCHDLAQALLADYPDLPGRFSLVATVDGVDYVDDALASNPLGLGAAIDSVAGRAVTLIVGGATRGADPAPVLARLAARTEPTVVLCTDDAVDLAPQLADVATEVVCVADLEEGVRTAHRVTPVGGAVLFSPGMPTPKAQGDWKHRSARFRAAVEALQ